MSDLSPTVAAVPTTQDFTSQILATTTSLSGTLTDYNKGSQIRTLAESVGSVIEQQGIWSNSLAFQVLMYGAMGVFGITPYPAFPGLGVATFSTAQGSGGFPINQNVSIPQGTVVQTSGGVQFTTSSGVVLVSGAVSVDAPISAVVGGLLGNVPSAAISQIVTGLLYPLFVTNSAPTSGGSNVEQLSQTVARFSAAISAIGLSSPVAIANAAIGVISSGTSEVVRYSTVYEPFLYAGSGVGSGTAGYSLLIDNGTGTATASLISAVTTVIDGNPASGQVGYRDAGVPYSVVAVSGTPVVVGVSGVVNGLTTTAVVSGLITAAVSGYFKLSFGTAAQQAEIAQAVGNSVLGLMTTLSVSLYASGSGSAVSGITPSASGRIILGSLNMSLS